MRPGQRRRGRRAGPGCGAMTVKADLRLFSEPALDARVRAEGVSGPSSDLETLEVSASGPLQCAARLTQRRKASCSMPRPNCPPGWSLPAVGKRPQRLRLGGWRDRFTTTPSIARVTAVLSAGSAGLDLAGLVLGIGRRAKCRRTCGPARRTVSLPLWPARCRFPC